MVEEDAEVFKKLKEELEAASKKEIVFLLIGKTGVGKSSTINSLLGEKIAEVGRNKPGARTVRTYRGEINGIKFAIIDTPGLCDAIPKKGRDKKYLERIQKAAPEIDCLWYVTRLDEHRFRPEEAYAIGLISKAFKPGLWERAMIVFTHAGNLTAEEFPESKAVLTKDIRREIARHTDQSTARKITAVAVDNRSATTPDGQPWLGELFTQVTERLSKSGTTPFILAMSKSFLRVSEKNKPGGTEAPRIQLSDSQSERVRTKFENSCTLWGKAAGTFVGSLFGQSGAMIGGALGEAFGNWVGRTFS
jgi:hypothetical protein